MLLSAGESRYLASLKAAQVHKREHVLYTLHDFFFLHFSDAQTEGDILEYIEMREKRIFLKNRIYRPFIWRHIVHLFIHKYDIAFIRGFKSADDAERGCLSAAGRTEQRHKFLIMDIEVNTFQYLFVVEAF